jgi:hypothetical protein
MSAGLDGATITKYVQTGTTGSLEPLMICWWFLRDSGYSEAQLNRPLKQVVSQARILEPDIFLWQYSFWTVSAGSHHLDCIHIFG